jgi:putative ABC transport system permease protein
VAGFLPIVGFKGERLFVYGVDLLTDLFIRDYKFAGATFSFDSALNFIAQPDSVALTVSLSRRLGFTVGSRVTLSTSRGTQDYTVRALLKEEGTAKVFGGSFALMDLPVAQRAFGKEGKLDIVDLTVEEGVEIESVRERMEAGLQGVALVERPRERGKHIESLLTSFRVGLFFVSLIALFVGFFLIFNTIAISVVQRKREIGTLRCLGLLRRDILWLLIVEAFLIALPGSLAGVLMGLLLAKGAVLLTVQSVSNLFFEVDLTSTAFSWRDLWIGLASGLGVSLVAALYPAVQATRVSPLENYRRAVWSPRSQRPIRATVFGFVLLIASILMWLYSPDNLGGVRGFTWGMVAAMVFLLALCFLSPLFVYWSVRFLRLCMRRLTWVGGRLGIDNLDRSPSRCGITVATLMISLASILIIATFINSVRGSLISWVDRMITADLIVSSSSKTAGPMNVPLKEDLAGELRNLSGVQVLDLYRLIRSTYQGKPILVESFSAKDSQDVRDLPMVEGEKTKALSQMAKGEGVLVSESFKARFDKGQGDVVELPTPSGIQRFTVVGVYVDYSSDSGSVLIDRALYKRLWNDELVDAFDLWLIPGTDEQAVIQTIKRNYGDKYQLFVSTHRELRETVVGIMEQSFIVNYAVLLVAVVVSVLNWGLASHWCHAGPSQNDGGGRGRLDGACRGNPRTDFRDRHLLPACGLQHKGPHWLDVPIPLPLWGSGGLFGSGSCSMFVSCLCAGPGCGLSQYCDRGGI